MYYFLTGHSRSYHLIKEKSDSGYDLTSVAMEYYHTHFAHRICSNEYYLRAIIAAQILMICGELQDKEIQDMVSALLKRLEAEPHACIHAEINNLVSKVLNVWHTVKCDGNPITFKFRLETEYKKYQLVYNDRNDILLRVLEEIATREETKRRELKVEIDSLNRRINDIVFRNALKE